MSEKPTKEGVKAVFDELDADKSGKLSLEDLKKISEKFGKDPNEEEIQEFIQLCDASGDGKVSFDEFWETVLKYHKE